MTWGAHAQQIRRCALFLAAAGLKSGERACIFAPNRVEWMARRAGDPGGGRGDGAVYASSTAEQAAYVVSHCDARSCSSTRPLVARVLEAWDAYAAVERIVLLDDALDVGQVANDCATRGKKVPPVSEVERKFVPWSRASAMGAVARPGGPERVRAHDGLGVSLDQPGMMLYTSGTSGNPKGVSNTVVQR